MKKISLFLILLMFPLVVNAQYDVKTHLIDVEIEIAGSLRVKELIVIEGSTDYFSRTINYKYIENSWDKKTINFKESPIYNGEGLENVKVSAYKIGEELDFNAFGDNINYFKEYILTKEKEKVYTEVKNDFGATYNIYKKVNNERYAFYLEYLISNVVVVHEDVQEINFTFKNLDLGADNTMLRVVIPYPTKSDAYNFWLHAPASTKLNELVDSNDDKVGFIAQFTNLKTDVNFRMSLPKEQVGIDIYLNHTNVNGLKEIQKAEENRINKLNLSDQALTVIKYVLIIFSLIYASSAFIIPKQKIIYILYSFLGLILILFNYLSGYNLIYLYFIIILPLIIKLTYKRMQ